VNLGRKSYPDRVYRCTCGLTIDRDLNASFNILRSSGQTIGIQIRRSPRRHVSAALGVVTARNIPEIEARVNASEGIIEDNSKA